MTLFALLLTYSALIFAASFMGGWLPTVLRMSHTRVQLMMSFVAGLMLGVACYHLLPHAIMVHGGDDAADQVAWWLMIGLLFMFVLLRTFHFHQHDHNAVGEDGSADLSNIEHVHFEQDHKGARHAEHRHLHQSHLQHDHSQHGHSQHGHAKHGQRQQDHGAHPLSWMGIALGLSVHTLIDGIALGAAIQIDAGQHLTAGLFSIGVFAAIVLHKPLDAMSITALMVAGGWTAPARMMVNAGFALMCPLGALLFLWGLDQIAADRDVLVGCALAFSAGVFLCISLSDLLPEVQFHSHDRAKLTIALLLGIVLAYGIGLLEPQEAHRHDVPDNTTIHPH